MNEPDPIEKEIRALEDEVRECLFWSTREQQTAWQISSLETQIREQNAKDDLVKKLERYRQQPALAWLDFLKRMKRHKERRPRLWERLIDPND